MKEHTIKNQKLNIKYHNNDSKNFNFALKNGFKKIFNDIGRNIPLNKTLHYYID